MRRVGVGPGVKIDSQREVRKEAMVVRCVEGESVTVSLVGSISPANWYPSMIVWVRRTQRSQTWNL